MPRTPHRPRKPTVGFRVVHELFFNRIPLQFASEAQRDVLLLHHSLIPHRDFDWADRLLSASNRIQKIAAMVGTAHYLNLIRSDFFRGERGWIRDDAVPADENP